MGVGWGGGFGMIQARCTYCALYFYFVAISGYSVLTLGLRSVLLGESNAAVNLTGGGTQTLLLVMGSSCKCR